MKRSTVKVARPDGSTLPTEVPCWLPGVPGLVVNRPSLTTKTCVVTHAQSGRSLGRSFWNLKEARAWARELAHLDWTRPEHVILVDPAVRAALGIEPPPAEDQAEPLSEPFTDDTFTWDGEALTTPSTEQVRAWVLDSVCEALDGCTVEPDGTCPHGAPSWLRTLGMV